MGPYGKKYSRDIGGSYGYPTGLKQAGLTHSRVSWYTSCSRFSHLLTCCAARVARERGRADPLDDAVRCAGRGALCPHPPDGLACVSLYARRRGLPRGLRRLPLPAWLCRGGQHRWGMHPVQPQRVQELDWPRRVRPVTGGVRPEPRESPPSHTAGYQRKIRPNLSHFPLPYR